MLALVLPMILPSQVADRQHPLPIIDMHLHASSADRLQPARALCVPLLAHLPPAAQDGQWDHWRPTVTKDPPCSNPIWSPTTEEALVQETIAILRRHNIFGVLSGSPERVRRWTEAAANRFIPAVEIQFASEQIDLDTLRTLYTKGPFAVLGEIENQYAGIAPDDPRMEPYWKLAEELDVPVAIHMGEGPPAGPYFAFPRYRVKFGSPLLLEDVLVRHPKLRIYVMHYGSPLVDEMIAILQSYPQVYVETGGIQWLYPRSYFYGQLKRLIDAGFEKRIMFGSDQMIWPGVIESAIAIIQETPFLTEEQKRDILYNNAARFLRLSNREITRHYGFK
jgi:uncharacterized protein